MAIYFPDDMTPGLKRRYRFWTAPRDWKKITDEWEYEDGGKDFNEVSDDAPRRWEYFYNKLTKDQWAILDAFYNQVRHSQPFNFAAPDGFTYTNVFIEDYKRNHDEYKSWKSRVEFYLVGYSCQVLNESGGRLLRSIDVGRTTGGTVGDWEQDIFSGGALADYSAAAVDQTGETSLISDGNARTIRYVTTVSGSAITGTFTGLAPNAWYRLRPFFFVDGGTFQTIISVNGVRQLHHKYPRVASFHVDNRDIVAKTDSSGNLAVSITGEGTGTIDNTGIISAIQLFSTNYTTDYFSKQIICEGDSITEGAMIYLTGGTYPNQLAALLNANSLQPNQTYFNAYNPEHEWLVRNVGYSGQTSADMISTYSAQIGANYAAGKQNYLVLLAGTNDINNGDSAATILTRLTSLVTSAHASGFTVFIGTITPRTDFNLTKNTVKTTLNNSILAGNTGADAVVDFAANANLSNAANTTYYGDGIHLTAAGYAIMAAMVQSALETTPDITAPSIPSSLSATAISSSRIDLSWTASTDDTAVTGYNIRRATNSSFTAGVTDFTSVTNSFSDTSCAAATQYYYKVAAHDAVPNTSAYSSSANATTSAGAQNFALASNGATASATSEYNSNLFAANAINGYRHTNGNWNASGTGGGWGADVNATITIDFNASRTITEIDLITLADAYNGTTDPTLTDTFTLYGQVNFAIDYWNGTSWVNITTVTGNNKVWRQFTFSAITTTKIRVVCTGAAAGSVWSRVVEIEAWG